MGGYGCKVLFRNSVLLIYSRESIASRCGIVSRILTANVQFMTKQGSSPSLLLIGTSTIPADRGVRVPAVVRIEWPWLLPYLQRFD